MLAERVPAVRENRCLQLLHWYSLRIGSRQCRRAAKARGSSVREGGSRACANRTGEILPGSNAIGYLASSRCETRTYSHRKQCESNGSDKINKTGLSRLQSPSGRQTGRCAVTEVS